MKTEGIKAHIARIIPLHSMSTLKDFHKSIREGLMTEDALPAEAPRRHGFRRYADFRWESDAIEAELESRGESFVAIAW